MPHIDYPNVITESPEQLHELEKRHRYTHLFQRVRMLRLLKSGECSNLGEAADALGYSRRQCQRWWSIYYAEGGVDELLVSRVAQRGRQELITEEAWEELEGVMKEGRIATYAQAHAFLRDRGIEYANPDSVGQLFRRRKAKLKTGRPRHEKADPQEQEACRHFSTDSPKPTPMTIWSSCSMALRAIVRERSSVPKTSASCRFLPTLPNSTRLRDGFKSSGETSPTRDLRP